jgi:type IV secretory pathway VirJ component
MKLATLFAVAATALSPPPAAAPATAMPVIERPAAGAGDTLVVFYSGDGGWAGLDRGFTDSVSKAGVPVVGVDSLRYFWNGRSAEQAAADLDAALVHYLAAWKKSKVILVGYSFGAGALPPIVARLPPQIRARVRLMALVAAEPYGDLHFHLGSWLNQRSPSAYPLAPIVAGLRDVPTVCVYGERDREEGCAGLAARPLRLAGDHHFNGDYGGVSRAVLRAAGL